MIDSNRVNKILFGGDYNPEQWTPEIWEEDMKLLLAAHIDIVTINVFNWAMLQPEEEVYDFSMLDATVNRVVKHDMKICMATATGAHPAWMARKYPDILRTEFTGMKRKFGGRHNSCPNSPTFQKYSVRLAEKIAERYKDNRNIVSWHVSNEYGGACYCENCEKAFRVWLKRKYVSIDKLNHEWNTHFWGRTYYTFDDIVLPNLLSEHFEEKRSMNQGATLDYMRFNSDGMLQNYMAEQAAIKKIIPDADVTTNMMGFYKQLDYKKWAQEMDFVSWDNYPTKEESAGKIALKHELMRGIKGGKPFALMEQTPSVSNWLSDNSLKRPGQLRLESYQAIAHGADTVMFFQMRQSPASCEKFHGAVIGHAGSNQARVYKECAAIGRELLQIGDRIPGSRTISKVAILFDWDNWWALEGSAGPNKRLDYVEETTKYYQAFYERNISVDIIGPEDDFEKYQLILIPILYMVKPGVAERLEAYAASGKSVLLTFLSGLVNENDYIMTGGYPGSLRKLCGIWVEEFDSLGEGGENHFIWKDISYPARDICDVIHTEGAQPLAFYENKSYAENFYAGMPVVTKNIFDKGQVYYVGTSSSQEFYNAFIGEICEELSIYSALEGRINASVSDTGLEIAVREKGKNRYTFFLNHDQKVKELRLPFAGVDVIDGKVYEKGEVLRFAAYDVHIIEYTL